MVTLRSGTKVSGTIVRDDLEQVIIQDARGPRVHGRTPGNLGISQWAAALRALRSEAMPRIPAAHACIPHPATPGPTGEQQDHRGPAHHEDQGKADGQDPPTVPLARAGAATGERHDRRNGKCRLDRRAGEEPSNRAVDSARRARRTCSREKPRPERTACSPCDQAEKPVVRLAVDQWGVRAADKCEDVQHETQGAERERARDQRSPGEREPERPDPRRWGNRPKNCRRPEERGGDRMDGDEHQDRRSDRLVLAEGLHREVHRGQRKAPSEIPEVSGRRAAEREDAARPNADAVAQECHREEQGGPAKAPPDTAQQPGRGRGRAPLGAEVPRRLRLAHGGLARLRPHRNHTISTHDAAYAGSTVQNATRSTRRDVSSRPDS
jgi:hypothetical protein